MYRHGHNRPPNSGFPKGYDNGHRFKKGQNLGDKNWCWKGGRMIDTNGYAWVRAVGHPKARRNGFYVYEHRLVMEQYLGRYLTEDEDIHHKNGNKQDNRIKNLKLMSSSEHSSFETWLKWLIKKYP